MLRTARACSVQSASSGSLAAFHRYSMWLAYGQTSQQRQCSLAPRRRAKLAGLLAPTPLQLLRPARTQRVSAFVLACPVEPDVSPGLRKRQVQQECVERACQGCPKTTKGLCDEFWPRLLMLAPCDFEICMPTEDE